jgi:hypothetical protein
MDHNVLDFWRMLPHTIRQPLTINIDGSEGGVAFLYALDRFEKRSKCSPHDTPFDLNFLSLKVTFAEPATIDADVSIFANWLQYRRRQIPTLVVHTASPILHKTANELLTSFGDTLTQQLDLIGMRITGPHSKLPVPRFSPLLCQLRVDGPVTSQDYLSAWIGQYHRFLRQLEFGASKEIKLRPHPRVQHLSITIPSSIPFDEVRHLLNRDVPLRHLRITGMQIPGNLRPTWTFRNLPQRLDANITTAVTLIRCSENKLPLTQLTCRPTRQFTVSYDTPGMFLNRLHSGLEYLPNIKILNVVLPRYTPLGDSVFAKESTRAFHSVERLSIAFSRFSLRDVVVRIALMSFEFCSNTSYSEDYVGGFSNFPQSDFLA